jgi:multidrug efflux system membrane fusion protein
VRDEAQLAAARVTLGRYEQLWKQDSIARQDVDTQTALVKQLEGTVLSDKASEANARINLGYTRITAPMAGRIGLRVVDPGNMVAAGATTGIATITQMAPIDVKFAVPQDRVPEVLQAQRAGTLPVQALDRNRDDVLARGRFLTLDNVIDTTTGTLLGKARFDNGDGQLFPNQFVNVRLQLGATPGVLVPVTAVRTGPKGDYVYVVDGQQTAEMRTVQRGGATVDQVLILSGVAAGETVVTEGGDRVRDGGRVQLAGQSPMGGASGAGGMRGPRARGSGAGAAGAPWRGASGASGAPMGGASGAAPGEGRRGPPGMAASAPAGAAPAPGGAERSRSDRPPAPDGQARRAPENAASGGPGPGGFGGPGGPSGGASRPRMMDSLPPEVREKVQAMSPDERRAFFQKLREQRAAQGGGQ